MDQTFHFCLRYFLAQFGHILNLVKFSTCLGSHLSQQAEVGCQIL